MFLSHGWQKHRNVIFLLIGIVCIYISKKIVNKTFALDLVYLNVFQYVFYSVNINKVWWDQLEYWLQ